MAACRTVPFRLCTENTAPQTPRSSSASGQKNQKEIRLPLQEKGKHLKNLITIQGKKWRAQQRVLIIAQRVLCAISKNSRCGDTPGKDQRVSSSWKARQQWAARECRRGMTHSLLPLSSKPSGLNSSASGIAVERGGGEEEKKPTSTPVPKRENSTEKMTTNVDAACQHLVTYRTETCRRL